MRQVEDMEQIETLGLLKHKISNIKYYPYASCDSICVKSQHMQHNFSLFFSVLTEFGVDTACMAVHYPCLL